MNNINHYWSEFCNNNSITNIQNLIDFVNNNLSAKYILYDNINLLHIFYDWNYKLNIDIDDNNIKLFNNIIINDNLDIIFYGGNKIYDSIRDNFSYIDLKDKYNFNSEELHIYESYEGTIINIFYYNNIWYYATRKKINMYESYFNAKIS